MGRRTRRLLLAVAALVPLGIALAHVAASPRTPRLPDTPYRYSVDVPAAHFMRRPALVGDNTPPDNHITDAGATLGRVLFYERRLSVNHTTSCGSCHVQRHAFGDPNRFSRGFDGALTDRRAMPLGNLRYYARARFFWDERAGNLEEMVLQPIENPIEMGHRIDAVVADLGRDPFYPPLFSAAFGNSAVTRERIGRALAQFIRAMVSYQSRYDAGRVYASDVTVDFHNFSVRENRGKALFLRHCASCHLRGDDAHFLLDEPVNTGLDSDPRTADGGVGEVTLRDQDLGRFKAPTLRNIAVSGPYMHDGRLPTLDAVIDHYSDGFQRHRNLDPRLQPLKFTPSEKVALKAFLETLTDDTFLTDPKFSDPFE